MAARTRIGACIGTAVLAVVLVIAGLGGSDRTPQASVSGEPSAAVAPGELAARPAEVAARPAPNAGGRWVSEAARPLERFDEVIPMVNVGVRWVSEAARPLERYERTAAPRWVTEATRPLHVANQVR